MKSEKSDEEVQYKSMVSKKFKNRHIDTQEQIKDNTESEWEYQEDSSDQMDKESSNLMDQMDVNSSIKREVEQELEQESQLLNKLKIVQVNSKEVQYSE